MSCVRSRCSQDEEVSVMFDNACESSCLPSMKVASRSYPVSSTRISLLTGPATTMHVSVSLPPNELQHIHGKINQNNSRFPKSLSNQWHTKYAEGCASPSIARHSRQGGLRWRVEMQCIDCNTNASRQSETTDE